MLKSSVKSSVKSIEMLVGESLKCSELLWYGGATVGLTVLGYVSSGVISGGLIGLGVPVVYAINMFRGEEKEKKECKERENESVEVEKSITNSWVHLVERDGNRPEYIGKEEGYLVYSKPRGVIYSDVAKQEERIKSYLGMEGIELKVSKETIKIKERNIGGKEIFKILGCKNDEGVYVTYDRTEGRWDVYKVPLGISTKNIESLREDIRTIKGYEVVEMKFDIKNKELKIREKIDEIGSFKEYPYKKREEGDKTQLIARVGKTKTGELRINFSKYYHLLIAGATGGGKSSIIRTLLTDLMLNYSVEELEINLVDLKLVELKPFEKFKHIKGGCITKVDKVGELFAELLKEKDRRLELFEKEGVLNLEGYNKKSKEKLAWRVVVIDELLDIITNNQKWEELGKRKLSEVLSLILSQARAVGIYIILSTQHPSRKLIDADIQTNILHRIGLKVVTKGDVSIVLPGAEEVPLHEIASQGRFYYNLSGRPKAEEVQGYYIGDPAKANELEEIEKLIK